MPRTYVSPAQDRLEQLGMDQIEQWLGQGKGLRYIGEQAGCNAVTVMRWINSDQQRSARAMEATLASADGFEDEAIGILEQARQEVRDDPQISSAIVALAKERAQAAWRQASVRDPRRYSDRRTVIEGKVEHTHSVASLSTAQLEAIAAQGSSTLELDNTTGEVS